MGRICKIACKISTPDDVDVARNPLPTIIPDQESGRVPSTAVPDTLNVKYCRNRNPKLETGECAGVLTNV